MTIRPLIRSAYLCLFTLSVLAFGGLPTVAEAQMSGQMCSGARLSKMVTMVGGMPDGPHKREMYKRLAVLNTAMSKDGTRGCEVTMKAMHRHHHQMHHMGN